MKQKINTKSQATFVLSLKPSYSLLTLLLAFVVFVPGCLRMPADAVWDKPVKTTFNISIDSKPSGAEVYIGLKLIGKTPLKRVPIEANYTISKSESVIYPFYNYSAVASDKIMYVKKSGYNTEVEIIKFISGEKNVRLEKTSYLFELDKGGPGTYKKEELLMLPEVKELTGDIVAINKQNETVTVGYFDKKSAAYKEMSLLVDNKTKFRGNLNIHSLEDITQTKLDAYAAKMEAAYGNNIGYYTSLYYIENQDHGKVILRMFIAVGTNSKKFRGVTS